MLSFLQSSKTALTLLRERVPARPPERTSVEAIALADIESPEVATIAAAWQKWRGLHAMPSREKLSLRDLGRAAMHVSLARLVGEDYEFRIIGDAHVQAYGTDFVGKRVSDVVAAAPEFGSRLKTSYDLVRTTGSACAYRGAIGMDIPNARFVRFETCYLPLGDSSGVVDHVLNAAVYTPRGGW